MHVSRFHCMYAVLISCVACIEVLTYLYLGYPPSPLTSEKEISAADSMKDLGVTLASTFKSSFHCQQAANRAQCILFHLRRGFAVLTTEIFRPLYLALARPSLEYGQQASSPYLRQYIALIKRIQRLAPSMVKGMRELPHEDSLRRLNIFSQKS